MTTFLTNDSSIDVADHLQESTNASRAIWTSHDQHDPATTKMTLCGSTSFGRQDDK